MKQSMLDRLVDLYNQQVELTEDFEEVLHEAEYETSLEENMNEEITNEDYD